MSCHAPIEQAHPKIGPGECVICHGGDRSAVDKETAHVAIPADLAAIRGPDLPAPPSPGYIRNFTSDQLDALPISSIAKARITANLTANPRHVVAVPTENVLIASSSIPFITSLEYHHPELNTVLEGFDKGEEWTWWLFPKNFRPDFVSSFAFEVDEDHVAWLKEHGLLANKIVYGMDSAGHERMRALGITRFIVDEGVPVIGR